MDYIEMKLRPNGEVVRLYNIFEDSTVLIFVPSLHQKANNGWQRVKASKLVPVDMPIDGNEMSSKTKKNKAKSQMKMIDATWQTTDGQLWAHEVIDKAIEHQISLIENQKKGEQEE